MAAAVSPMVPGSATSFRRPRLAVVERPVTYTVMPAAPSASAMPLPAPRLAPVTTAIFGAGWADVMAARPSGLRLGQMQEQGPLAPAMHGEQRAADIGGQRRCQVQARRGDVGRLGQAAQRKHRAHARDAGLAAIVLGRIL